MCQICSQFTPYLNDCTYEGLTGPSAPSADPGASTPQGVVLTETTAAISGITTTYSMDVGDYFFGTLDTTFDSDWIEVMLQAGQTYTFGLVGVGALTDNLSDPYLRLRDSAGAQIDFDDDGGPGRNSTITFTATTAGTYYLDVQSWNNTEAGDYGLSMVTGSWASYDVTMGAGNLLRPHISWGTAPGTGATVTWAIRDSGDDGNGFIAPSAAQVAAIENITALFDGISGLDLTQVNPGGTSNDATMLFGAYSANDGAGAYAYYPGSTASSADDGDVWLNNNSVSTGSLPLGSYSYFAIMHEIGHAVGLAHPGDYNAAPGVPITYANHAQFTEDTHQYTVMSYFDESNTTASFGSYPDTLMLYDILALHQQYGADMSFHAGDTTYGFNATVGGAYDFTTNTDPFLSIWDGNGTDMLDLSGYAMAQTINLGEGMFSDIGGFLGNVSIAIGAVIENAVGGLGNDTLIGNGAGNQLSGLSGSDMLMGGEGNDTLIGGNGMDTLVGGNGNDRLLGGELGDTLEGGGGSDSLYGEGGNDSLVGGTGTDLLVGQDGNDTLIGGNGADTLGGDGGEDRLLGGDLNDLLNGGGGQDLLYGENGNDRLLGETGADLLVGQDGNDTLIGGNGNDTLGGDGGEDRLLGGDLNDLLNGGSDNDLLFGEGGSDRLLGETGDDLLYGQDGNDTLIGGNGNDTLSGGDGHDRLLGGDRHDLLNGGTGNDWMFGGSGNDRLVGGAGIDVLMGQEGADTLLGGGDSDIFVFSDGWGQDVLLGFDATDGAEDIMLTTVSEITDYADLMADHITDLGGSVQISDGLGNTIFLDGVDFADLDITDFTF